MKEKDDSTGKDMHVSQPQFAFMKGIQPVPVSGRVWVHADPATLQRGRQWRACHLVLLCDTLLVTQRHRQVVFVTEQPIPLTAVLHTAFNVRRKETEFQLCVAAAEPDRRKPRTLVFRASSLGAKLVWEDKIHKQMSLMKASQSSYSLTSHRSMSCDAIIETYKFEDLKPSGRQLWDACRCLSPVGVHPCLSNSDLSVRDERHRKPARPSTLRMRLFGPSSKPRPLKLKRISPAAKCSQYLSNLHVPTSECDRVTPVFERESDMTIADFVKKRQKVLFDVQSADSADGVYETFLLGDDGDSGAASPVPVTRAARKRVTYGCVSVLRYRGAAPPPPRHRRQYIPYLDDRIGEDYPELVGAPVRRPPAPQAAGEVGRTGTARGLMPSPSMKFADDDELSPTVPCRQPPPQGVQGERQQVADADGSPRDQPSPQHRPPVQQLFTSQSLPHRHQSCHDQTSVQGGQQLADTQHPEPNGHWDCNLQQSDGNVSAELTVSSEDDRPYASHGCEALQCGQHVQVTSAMSADLPVYDEIGEQTIPRCDRDAGSSLPGSGTARRSDAAVDALPCPSLHQDALGDLLDGYGVHMDGDAAAADGTSAVVATSVSQKTHKINTEECGELPEARSSTPSALADKSASPGAMSSDAFLSSAQNSSIASGSSCDEHADDCMTGGKTDRSSSQCSGLVESGAADIGAHATSVDSVVVSTVSHIALRDNSADSTVSLSLYSPHPSHCNQLEYFQPVSDSQRCELTSVLDDLNEPELEDSAYMSRSDELLEKHTQKLLASALSESMSSLARRAGSIPSSLDRSDHHLSSSGDQLACRSEEVLPAHRVEEAVTWRAPDDASAQLKRYGTSCNLLSDVRRGFVPCLRGRRPYGQLIAKTRGVFETPHEDAPSARAADTVCAATTPHAHNLTALWGAGGAPPRQATSDSSSPATPSSKPLSSSSLATSASACDLDWRSSDLEDPTLAPSSDDSQNSLQLPDLEDEVVAELTSSVVELAPWAGGERAPPLSDIEEMTEEMDGFISGSDVLSPISEDAPSPSPVSGDVHTRRRPATAARPCEQLKLVNRRAHADKTFHGVANVGSVDEYLKTPDKHSGHANTTGVVAAQAVKAPPGSGSPVSSPVAEPDRARTADRGRSSPTVEQALQIITLSFSDIGDDDAGGWDSDLRGDPIRKLDAAQHQPCEEAGLLRPADRPDDYGDVRNSGLGSAQDRLTAGGRTDVTGVKRNELKPGDACYRQWKTDDSAKAPHLNEANSPDREPLENTVSIDVVSHQQDSSNTLEGARPRTKTVDSASHHHQHHDSGGEPAETEEAGPPPQTRRHTASGPHEPAPPAADGGRLRRGQAAGHVSGQEAGRRSESPRLMLQLSRLLRHLSPVAGRRTTGAGRDRLHMTPIAKRLPRFWTSQLRDEDRADGMMVTEHPRHSRRPRSGKLNILTRQRPFTLTAVSRKTVVPGNATREPFTASIDCAPLTAQ